MTQLLERLQRRGVCRVLLEVRKSNTPAIRLYEKLGFSMLGIRRDFYERPREDACMMAYPTVSTGE
jgi:ribosomal-protein-alanine N-acetyltransferase